MISLSHVGRASMHRFARVKSALAALIALDVGTEALDFYNTLLEAHGTRRRLGPVEREFRRLDRIRA